MFYLDCNGVFCGLMLGQIVRLVIWGELFGFGFGGVFVLGEDDEFEGFQVVFFVVFDVVDGGFEVVVVDVGGDFVWIG